MRTSIARIRLYLKEGKKLATGEFPIMLMCSFHGRKEVSTGYSCIPKYWDKSNQCIKKGYANYVMINAHIKKLKDDAIAKRDAFIAMDEVYTPEMVLARDVVRDIDTNDFKGLITRYIDEKGLEYRTIEKWWIVYRSVLKYSGRKSLLINEINEAFCRRYCKWLEGNGLSSGSIKSYMGKVVALLHYAVGLKLIDSYPLENWKYHKEYRESKSELYIHARTMNVMMEMFIDELIIRNKSTWTYREGVIEKLMDIHSDIYAHYLYIITYYLCGLAPLDVSLLKKKDIKTTMIKEKTYYVIDGHRSKTGMPYHMLIPMGCLESNVLIRTMLMFNSGDYFLPTLNGFDGNIKKRVNNLYTSHGSHLVDWFQKVNEECVRRNVEEDAHLELINLDCRYYSARHSYIMAQIQKPSVNLLKIATVTGKSVTTLHQYLTYLNDIDLAE